eukprot:2366360-Pyramimonas_sp.AAC.1
MDFLVIDAAKSVAITGRGAHRARTPGPPYAGPPVLPVKKHSHVDVFLAKCTLSSSALRIAQRERDAAQIAGGRLLVSMDILVVDDAARRVEELGWRQ